MTGSDLANHRPRLAVRVTRDAERQIRSGHPWLFDGSITSISPGGQPGDLAVVFDAKRRFLAIGLFDPESPIRVRILHHGSPAPIDSWWLTERVAAADERRRSIIDDPTTTGYRVIHGENDGLGGLVLDRYDQTLVLKLYSSAWFVHLDQLTAAITARFDPDALVVRMARLVARSPHRPRRLDEGDALVGAAPDRPVEFLENGLVMNADVVAGHKTGYFLDQRDNRVIVKGLAEGRRVLDLYCCTGGFSVHAAAGGATEVHSVDISAPAVDATRRAMAANRHLPAVAACAHTTATGDALGELTRLARQGRRFDLVVVDPPNFASSAAQVPGALRAYTRLAELAAEVTRPGGTALLASCSSRVGADEHLDAVRQGVARAGRHLEVVTRTGHAVDHPIGFAEGAYLKAVVARLAGGRAATTRRRRG